MDGLAGGVCVFIVPAWHFSGALRGSDLCARFCHRPDERALYSDLPRDRSRRILGAVRLARPVGSLKRRIQSRLSGGGHFAQQCAPRGLCSNGTAGNTLSPGNRCARNGQDLSRPPILQCRFYPFDGTACDPGRCGFPAALEERPVDKAHSASGPGFCSGSCLGAPLACVL